jgi:hypothetical protein
MKKLFLDDERDPIQCASYMSRRGIDVRIYHENWDIVRSYGEFVNYINTNGLPDLISFDHDLGDVPELKKTLKFDDYFDKDNDREYNGLDCAKFLIDYCMDNKLLLPKYIVHSYNPTGAENIKGLLDNYKKYESR